MASIKPHKDGYRAQVYVQGVRDSAVFRTKREASAWAGAREIEIRNDIKKSPDQKFTLLDMMKRYAEEVSVWKESGVREQKRLKAMEGLLPVDTLLVDIVPEHFAQWRDVRLKTVKPSTVIREFKLVSAMFEVARKEWRWISVNPVSDVGKPTPPPNRERVISLGEVRAMLRAFHYRSGPVRSVSHAVACTMLLALRTGARAGELCGLTWNMVSSDYITVGDKPGGRKTGIRKVAMTRQALRVIEQLKGYDPLYVVGLKSSTLDANFRKYRDRAGLSGFTFHDTRHTAATWIAQKIDVLDLCKMFGWSNPKMAMVYYNPTASDIAKRLGRKAV